MKLLNHLLCSRLLSYLCFWTQPLTPVGTGHLHSDVPPPRIQHVRTQNIIFPVQAPAPPALYPQAGEEGFQFLILQVLSSKAITPSNK